MGGGGTDFNKIAFTSSSLERALCPLHALVLPPASILPASPGGLGVAVLELGGQQQKQLGWEHRVPANLEKVVMPLPLPSSPFLEKGLPL